jgi:dolichyl-phosphate beta-glucosyltransferase
MFAGRGKYLLMVDADGATEISDLTRLLERMKRIEKNDQGIVVGSRAHLVDNVVAKVLLLTLPSSF